MSFQAVCLFVFVFALKLFTKIFHHLLENGTQFVKFGVFIWFKNLCHDVKKSCHISIHKACNV